MTANEFLKNHLKLEQNVKHYQQELLDLKQDAMTMHGADYSQPRVATGHKHNANFEKKIDKLDEMQRDFVDVLIDLLEQRALVEQIIDCVPDELQQLVLFARYILQHKFDDIARDFKYSSETIYKSHAHAMNYLATIDADKLLKDK